MQLSIKQALIEVWRPTLAENADRVVQQVITIKTGFVANARAHPKGLEHQNGTARFGELSCSAHPKRGLRQLQGIRNLSAGRVTLCAMG